MSTDSELRARNLALLAMLGGLFLLPLAISFWMYYGTDWRPTGRVNHGELISPARPLPATSLPQTNLMQANLTQETVKDAAPAELFRHRWSLVYIGDGRCDDACRHVLYVMRQTRLSLNNEMTRVERVFLVTAACCASEFLEREHPGLNVVNATGTAAAVLLGIFPAAARDQSLFIVDPLGNLMMSYDARQNPKGLLEDLKKLLTLSHIG